MEDYADRLDDTGMGYLKMIVDNSKKMNVLIENILRLSRISCKQILKKDIDLTGMAREIIAELHQLQPERQVKITIQENMNIQGDRQLLKIALTNLLQNAWKYTGNTTYPSIEFGSIQKDSKTVFFVRDNGCGFPMKEMENLFQPFHRLHSGKLFSGSGIGLSITKRVVECHGGRIWAEGKDKEGATFYFTL